MPTVASAPAMMRSMASIDSTSAIHVGDIRLKLASMYGLKELGIQVQAEKFVPKTNLKSPRPGPVFGSPLASVVKHHGMTIDDHVRIPSILFTIVESITPAIATVGVFRISAGAAHLRKMVEDANRGDNIVGGVHDMAALLKLFLRGLPEPLLTYRLYHSFIECGKMSDKRSQLMAIRELCLLLPVENLHSLVYICAFMARVAEVPNNKMETATLATILAPNLLKPVPNKNRKKSHVSKGVSDAENSAIAAEFANHGHACTVVDVMIRYNAELSEIPRHMLSTAARLSEAEATKLYFQEARTRKRSSGGWWWPFWSKRKDKDVRVTRTQSAITPSQSPKAPVDMRSRSGSAIPDFVELGGSDTLDKLPAKTREMLLSAGPQDRRARSAVILDHMDTETTDLDAEGSAFGSKRSSIDSFPDGFGESPFAMYRDARMANGNDNGRESIGSLLGFLSPAIGEEKFRSESVVSGFGSPLSPEAHPQQDTSKDNNVDPGRRQTIESTTSGFGETEERRQTIESTVTGFGDSPDRRQTMESTASGFGDIDTPRATAKDEFDGFDELVT